MFSAAAAVAAAGAAPATLAPPPATLSVAEEDAIAERTSLSSSYVRGLEEKLEYHRKVIRLYQNLSSLAIHPKRTDDGAVAEEEEEEAVDGGGKGKGRGRGDVMTCTAVNHLHRRAVRFDLAIPQDEETEDFYYRATGNAHLLPEYMKVSELTRPFCFERILVGWGFREAFWFARVPCGLFPGWYVVAISQPTKKLYMCGG